MRPVKVPMLELSHTLNSPVWMRVRKLSGNTPDTLFVNIRANSASLANLPISGGTAPVMTGGERDIGGEHLH